MKVRPPLQTFSAAVLSVKLQLLEIGEPLPFPDAEVDICEDLRSAVLFVPVRGHWVYSGFDLPEPVANEDQFNSNAYERAAINASRPATMGDVR